MTELAEPGFNGTVAPPQTTLVQEICAVQERLERMILAATREGRLRAAREFTLAINHAEDMISRINRGMEMQDGCYQVEDYQKCRWEQLSFPDPDPEHP